MQISYELQEIYFAALKCNMALIKLSCDDGYRVILLDQELILASMSVTL